MPTLLQGQRLDGVADDVEQWIELGGGAIEVVGRQQPQGDDLDADLLTPAQERLDIGGPGQVSGCGLGADSLGPTPVAVEHDAHMFGHPIWRERARDPGFVCRVEHPSYAIFPTHGSDSTSGRDQMRAPSLLLPIGRCGQLLS